jgi:cytochrome c oxidase subunit 2
VPPRSELAAACVLLAAAVASGCGDDSGANLSETAADGRRIVSSSGCSGCHGGNGQGGVGPAFVGLYGAERELEDGATVVADDAYLTESIRDPSAKLVAGYSQRMPDNGLDDDDIATVVQYIRELTPSTASTTPVPSESSAPSTAESS